MKLFTAVARSQRQGSFGHMSDLLLHVRACSQATTEPQALLDAASREWSNAENQPSSVARRRGSGSP
jgi:hypothetical protein